MTGHSDSSSLLRTALVRAFLRLGDLHRRWLAVWFSVFGPRVAYRVTEVLARRLYRLMDPLRERSEAQCRAALGGGGLSADQVARIAEQAFVHRMWNLTDLMLAERLIHRNTYHLFGGRIPEPHLSDILSAQQRGQPTVLVAGYFGPFDLLPLFLGYNGIRTCVVYRPHLNQRFDQHRLQVRSRSGCELVPVSGAAERLGRILDAGGTVAIVADHHVERLGLPVSFLGLPTMASRSVALLAWRYGADVVVSGIRRVNREFRFAIDVADVIKQRDWAAQDDPVTYITQRYVRGLERIVLSDPSQYMWAYARWGRDFAQRLAAGDETRRTTN